MRKKVILCIIFVLSVFFINTESVFAASYSNYDTDSCIDNFGEITFDSAGNDNDVGGNAFFSNRSNNLDWNTDAVSYDVTVKATSYHKVVSVKYSIGSKYGYSCSGTVTGEAIENNEGSVKLHVVINQGYVNDMTFWGKTVNRNNSSKTATTESNKINVNKQMTDTELEAIGEEITIGEGETLTCDTIDDLLGKYWSWVLILAPVGTMILITIDFLTCMLSSDMDGLKKASKKTLNRVIALVILLMLPVITSLIFGLFGIETCF